MPPVRFDNFRMPAIPPPPTQQQPREVTDRRVICYHQTYYPDNSNEYVSMLPLLTQRTGVTHVILAALHLNDDPERITLNDDPLDAPKYAPLWEETEVLRAAGVKVMALLGGAARGSFARLDVGGGGGGSGEGVDEATFERYYGPLRDLLRAHRLQGIDLDIEEEMSLDGVVRLIDRLRADFGRGFVVTLAPVATALIEGLPHLSGFDYRRLRELRGNDIDWFNAQFYNGWGDIRQPLFYRTIVAQGWPPEKVVVGLLTNPGNGSQGYVPIDDACAAVSRLLAQYPRFGGVMGWEYFNSLPGDRKRPWEWAMRLGVTMAAKDLYDLALAFKAAQQMLLWSVAGQRNQSQPRAS